MSELGPILTEIGDPRGGYLLLLFKAPGGHAFFWLLIDGAWRLADDGRVAALCPNCHARVHYGADGDGFNREPIDRLAELEDVE